MSWKKDFFYGAFLFVFSIVNIIYAVATMTNPQGQDYPFAARTVPYMCLWLGILALLSLTLMYKGYRQRTNAQPPTTQTPIWTTAAVLTLFLSAVYVFCINYFGFLVSTPVYVFFLMMLYGFTLGKVTPQDKKKLLKYGLIYLLVSILFTIGVKILFIDLLNLFVPRGKIW